ncbi:unnamed protein product [Mycena citricolor]|uniref:C2H2-type domain-containing protein n=1 Tax=Mycena citricolor TaxID=2018698 RepID=A0AAD2HMC0_9AGAR|nr:unnamed protein product [Mycena citricolor]
MSDSTICPQVLAGSLCTERFCTFAHNPPSCDLCNLIFPTAPQYTEHVATKQHQNRLCGEFGLMLYCSACEKYIPGNKNWAVHVRSARHIKKAGGRHLEAEESGEMPGHTLCTTCNSQIPDKSWARHHLMPKHLAKTQFLSFRTALDEAEKDKNGVSVSGAFDFGIVEPSLAGAGVRVNASITNTTPYSIVSIVNASFASSRGVRMSTPFTLDLATAHRSICYKQTLNFTVSMCQSHNGRAQDRLELEFEDRQLGRRFVIMRTLAVIVGDRDDHENLRPSAPYVPRKRTARQPETNVVEGVAPPSLRVIRYVVVLPESPIPKALSAALATGTASSIVQNMRTVFLPPVLNSDTYPRHFKHLIWIEEHQMERDLQYYDITEAKLTVHHPYHYVSVPGLAEKRPSVLVGDRILVQQTGAAAGHWFEGGVHVVRKEEVGLRFHSSFGKASPLARFTVRFKLNRHPVRRQHLALDTAFDEDRVLFPEQTHMPAGPVPSKRYPVKNPLIAHNPPQLQAVVSIVERAPGSVPFVIFGP